MSARTKRARDGEAPEVWILWDPELVPKDDYAALVTACGDLVRASGGLGVERRNGAKPDVRPILERADK